MKSFPECLNCVIRQTIEILQRLVSSQEKQEQILLAVVRTINKAELEKLNPPELTKIAHDIIHRMTGIKDFFAEIKKRENEAALKLYPQLKKIVENSNDPLQTAARLAIAGNIIDYGAQATFNIDRAIKESLHNQFGANDLSQLKKDLKKAKLVLYIGDNTGEIVFDRLLVEQLIKMVEVVYVVKSQPVLNDVLMADAEMTGMTNLVKVIESGSDFAGTNPAKGTAEFKRLFKKADIIIAKGQGNFETLDMERRNIYFLLKMKCPCLAEATGFTMGDIILKRS
ncbi:MAG: ARMT1-like domain-containing protein [bacterium]